MTRTRGTASTADGVTDVEPLITREDAALILNMNPDLLYRWERDHSGPDYIRLRSRQVRYRRSDVQRFIDQRTVTAPRRTA